MSGPSYEERLAGIQADAVGAAWDPLLHPRARDGKFIRVNGWVRGLFRIAGKMEQLNGRVVGLRVNPKNARDPFVKVQTKHGEHETVISQISDAIEPKGFLSKVAEVLPWVEKTPEVDKPFDPIPEDLSGDIHFVTGQSLEGRDLNGIALTEQEFDPRQVLDREVGEPPLPETDKFLKQSSGVLIEEPDGRVWIYEPANHFGGYTSTFSKGRVEDEDTMQQAALREAYEELGLVAEITGYVGDYKGSVTMTRMYRGKRIGGAPWKHDDEVAEVRLVQPDVASEMLHTERDQQILSDLTGNPKYIEDWKVAHPPPPPKPKWQPKKWKDGKKGKPLSMSDQMDAMFGLYDDYEPQPLSDKEAALELTKKYGSSKLGADYDPIATAGPAGADGRFIRPGAYVHGRFTADDGTEQVMRLEVQALEPNPDEPSDPIVHALDADGAAVTSTVSQLTAVPATQAELDAAKAEFTLRFIQTKQTYDKTVQAYSNTPRNLNNLLPSEISNTGGDQLPTDFMYEVEAASTAVGKAIDDEIERRITVYSGDNLLTEAEFKAKHDELLAMVKVLNDKAQELIEQGGDPLGPQMQEIQDEAWVVAKSIDRLDKNRQNHRAAYARHAVEVLSEIIPGGMGGEVKAVTYPPGNMGIIKQVQKTVGEVYPSEWLAASNAHSMPVSIQQDPERSYYDFAKGHMKLPMHVASPYFDQVSVHEFGHRMEQVVPAIRLLEYAFFYRRNDKGAVQPKPLNVILGVPNVPGAPYGVNELARPDEFTNPYMGRDYGGTVGSYYELFTSGVERLLAKTNKQGVQGTNGLMRDDADYRAWVMGVLVNATPPKTYEDFQSGQANAELGTDVQDITFKVFLNDGRVINAKRIEQDDDGNISIISTMNERFFPAQIAKVYKPGEALPAPKDTASKLGFDPNSAIDAAPFGWVDTNGTLRATRTITNGKRGGMADGEYTLEADPTSWRIIKNGEQVAGGPAASLNEARDKAEGTFLVISGDTYVDPDVVPVGAPV